jgi:hypothetical protein
MLSPRLKQITELQSRIDGLASNPKPQSPQWQRTIAKAQADYEALRDNKPQSNITNRPDLTGIFSREVKNNFGELS